MASHRSPPRSRIETPELTPDAGLAEWTSKIKAMQRQVDADDEAEQMRLEQEIAASRLARIRRSQGLGYGSRTNSLDVSLINEGASDSFSGEPDGTSIDTPKTLVEKQSNHADALQRLTGASSSISSVPTSVKDLRIDRASTSASTSSDSRPEPISLAAFMGGRATGPRLNKHKPQQDAHDPTQFQQRSFDHAPHPTFGTGGVAMPGIAAQRDGLNKPSDVAALSKTRPSERVSELPPATMAYSETYQKQSTSPHSTETRERTLSTPSYASSSSKATANQAKPVSPVPHHSHLPPTYMATRTAVQSRDKPAGGVSTTPPLPKIVDYPVTPHQSTNHKTTPPPKSPVKVPSLAGPIQPQPRPAVFGPQIPASSAPSKAFLRPPPQKEPTPSLSRLQGRGFVQSMVHVSSQLGSPSVSNPETPVSTRPTTGKKGSVLERWQPNISPTTPSPSSRPPRSMRRSLTTDPTVVDKFQIPAADPPKKTVRGAASNPSLRQENIPPRASSSTKPNGSEANSSAGLGSATTLVVYKPKPIEVPPIDELGFKPLGVSRGAKGGIVDLPATSKPLSHPTKERARKPRKQKALPDDPQSTLSATVVTDISPIASPRASSDVPSVVSHPPLNEEGTPSENSMTSAKTLSVAPSAGEDQVSRVPVDQIPRAILGMVSARQSDTNITALRTVPPTDKVEQSSNRLIRQALPGLASQQSADPPLCKPAVRQTTAAEQTNHRVARRALPGVVPPSAPVPGKASEFKVHTQAPPHSPLLDKQGPSYESHPTKHTRIPSTGNRATVMEVAQALSESEALQTPEKPPALPDSPQTMVPNRPRSLAPLPVHAEKRRSSYEKYSSLMLPPLKEETTPVTTPAGTLSREEGAAQQMVSAIAAQEKDEQPSQTAGVLEKAISCLPPPGEGEMKNFPPGFNLDSLIKRPVRPAFLGPGTTTISVEVMAITGTTASTLTKDMTIFYDTEILAIIYRSKSQHSGLVSTAVWGWEGKRAKLGEREQRKLHELAKRYGTSVNIVHQESEPAQLVHVLGGVLAVRQGTRTHWTPENTAMHLVRSLGGVIIVDEKDLTIKNLCSAYSYCVSILGSVYIWYGRGSTPLERKAALEYGRCLTTNLPPIELTEGGNEDDEMFWMILGDGEYANADYWKWRRSSSITDPRIWRAKADLGKDCVALVDSISNEPCVHDSVYIIDCIWEFYVIVGSDARAHRDDIGLALDVASGMSAQVSSARPYPPTIHAIVLPSQLPRDLQLAFRDLDEFSVNKGDIPDHMNILSLPEAYSHLKQKFWDKIALQDQTMLPLGVDPSQSI
ncbi:hypothetical protein LshimejAT787_0405890 [Lyophyllum shimeji]|uniref:Gelsolin n=1 Tax=Lyophyllum shimeji TaxID=47721 RepID=A0A9P3ULE5_LYOSH|nr:hypothetical protein LshimejAT787_0405890 [Lyophyllum shimeji]